MGSEDKYCSACGTELTSSESRSKHTETSGTVQSRRGTRNAMGISIMSRVLVGGLFVLIVIATGVVFYKIIKKDPPPKGMIHIEKLSLDATIEPCRECTSVEIEGDVFPLSPLSTTTKNLRSELLKLAQNAGRFGSVSFFNEEKTNRVFDISFDISGSVVTLNAQDKAHGATELYSDTIINKVKEYLTKTEPILPNDTIRVHLYGNSGHDNVCKEKLEFKYTGPEYNAEFLYSNRANTAVIKVGNKLPALYAQGKGGVITTNDREKMFIAIKNFYVTNLERDNKFCNRDTFLGDNIQQVASSLDDLPVGERHYVMTNDGAFSFSDYYVTRDQYSTLNLYTSGQMIFKINPPLCKTKEDSLAFIGMGVESEYEYKDALSNFFSTILAPCRIIFR